LKENSFLRKYSLSEKNSEWEWLIHKACEEENGFMVSWFVTNFSYNEIPKECKEFVEKVENEHEIMIKPASKRFKGK